MPQPLAKLKAEMTFNEDLAHVVDAMKGIAASQYQVMERKRTRTEKYGPLTEELFEAYDFRRSHHPFVRASSEKKLIVAVTTDSGFLGGLNVKVLSAAIRHVDKDTHFFVIGERGANYLKEFNHPHTAYPGIEVSDSRYELAEKLAGDIVARALKEKVGHVLLIYPKSLSFLAQRIESLNIIPCPMFFKNRPRGVLTDEMQARQVILESKAKGIIEYLTVLWLKHRLIEIFELSKMSEFGARTMHLEESYSTLTKILKQLKLDFFKARRAKIDQSIRESFTSQLICEE